MNIENNKKELIEYGLLKGNKDFYLKIAQTLAKTYYNYFSAELIDKILKMRPLLEETMLPLDKFVFNVSYIDYLKYSELIRFKMLPDSYIIFNLKGQVKEFVINNSKIYINDIDIIQALQISQEKELSINYSKFYNYMQKMKLISLIYNYAYLILKECAKTELDFARAGMFKNAYYNIIELNEQEWFKIILNDSIKPKIGPLRA